LFTFPGVTTDEIDRRAHDFIVANGAALGNLAVQVGPWGSIADGCFHPDVGWVKYKQQTWRFPEIVAPLNHPCYFRTFPYKPSSYWDTHDYG